MSPSIRDEGSWCGAVVSLGSGVRYTVPHYRPVAVECIAHDRRFAVTDRRIEYEHRRNFLPFKHL